MLRCAVTFERESIRVGKPVEISGSMDSVAASGLLR
jgi:hypothetical protein